jgi:hypothetical protein
MNEAAADVRSLLKVIKIIKHTYKPIQKYYW